MYNSTYTGISSIIGGSNRNSYSSCSRTSESRKYGYLQLHETAPPHIHHSRALCTKTTIYHEFQFAHLSQLHIMVPFVNCEVFHIFIPRGVIITHDNSLHGSAHIYIAYIASINTHTRQCFVNDLYYDIEQ